ncbi:MAG: site-2 protease family protein [Patescibacteria group bacterium]|nr:site-2 protease family protein [Patescibacteria group bacterium]
MTTIFFFVVILGFFIFVHEAGHFLAARFFKVKAEEFGFGFPPRIFGLVFNHKNKRWELVRGNKELKRRHTIYSLNWIPLGGFVKIKGEDGDDKPAAAGSDSFTKKAIWQRIIILFSGVAMNFLAAAFILSLGFFLGLPQAVGDNQDNLKQAKIQIVDIAPNSPAKAMDLKPGDQITAIVLPDNSRVLVEGTEQVTQIIKAYQEQEIILEIKRGDDVYRFKGKPRKDYPKDQGSLGIVLTKTAIVSYPLAISVKMGFAAMFDMTRAILSALGQIVKDLVVQGRTQADVAGPIGIIMLTNQAAEMGLAYLIQFAAILSINLAIINILPFPALDGGRILFLIIEKIKKNPISREFEKRVHLTGFYILIALMLFVTVRDVFKFQDKFQVLWEKITQII